MAVLDEFGREIPSLGNELHHPHHHHRGRHSPSPVGGGGGQPLRLNSRSLSPDYSLHSRPYHTTGRDRDRDHHHNLPNVRRNSRERDGEDRLLGDNRYEERPYPATTTSARSRSRSTSPSLHFRRSSSHNGRDSPPPRGGTIGGGLNRRRSPSRERGGGGGYGGSMNTTLNNRGRSRERHDRFYSPSRSPSPQLNSLHNAPPLHYNERSVSSPPMKRKRSASPPPPLPSHSLDKGGGAGGSGTGTGSGNRFDSPPQHRNNHGGGGGAGGAGHRIYRSYSPERNRGRTSSPEYNRGGGGGGHPYDHAPRRHFRGDARGDFRFRKGGGSGGGTGGGGGGAGYDHRHHYRRKSLDSERYIQDPLLCFQLWKEEYYKEKGGVDPTIIVNDDTATNGDNGRNEEGGTNTSSIVKLEEGDGIDTDTNLQPTDMENKDSVVQRIPADEHHSTSDNNTDMTMKLETNSGENIMESNNESATITDTEMDPKQSEDPAAAAAATAVADPSSSKIQPSQPRLTKEQIAAEKAHLQTLYKTYNATYCLRYVRTFFNQHLDDEWFRQRYSPLEYKRSVEREKERCVLEAWRVLEEVEESLEGLKHGNGGGGGGGSSNEGDVSSFVINSRLIGGGGSTAGTTKNTVSTNTSMVGYSYMQQQQAGNSTRKRKYTTTDDGTITTGGNGNSNMTTTPVNDSNTSATTTTLNNNDPTATATTPSVTTPTKVPRLSTSATANLLNTLPKSHLHSFAQDNTALCIMDIPPHVTDAQLVYALSYHTTTTNADGSGNNNGGNGILHLCSSPVVSGPCEVVAGEDEDHEQGREEEDGGMGSTTGGEEMNGLPMEEQKNMGKNSGFSKIMKKEHGLLYFRTAWAIFDSEASKEKMLDNLTRANRESRDSRDRDGGPTPKVLELDVDCTDPYGRYEIDADGHGGAPTLIGDDDSINGGDAGTGAGAATDAKNEATPKVPVRNATVFVSTAPIISSQPTVVLSAAVSSLERIEEDRNTALAIGKRLDITRDVPRGARLENVLEKLFPSCSFRDVNIVDGKAVVMDDTMQENVGDDDALTKQRHQQRMEDVLDVCIAYLRRVHLFTFYNGCTSSDDIGSMLGGHHSARTIHLRLQGADEILKKTKEEHAVMYDDLPMADAASTADKEKIKSDPDDEMVDESNSAGEENIKREEDIKKETESVKDLSSEVSKDMLVRRLDASISKALDSMTNSDMDVVSPFVVNEVVDAVASEIESTEEKTKKEWVRNHSVIDGDGKARCSFHFCRKLFKDVTYLQKHLLKKHADFLKADVAKCHDSYMMNWWDREVCRPVPPVTVNCGQFGLQPSTVIGSNAPMVTDPEPELWREKQERLRKQEEEEERYRQQQQAAAEANAERHRRNLESQGGDQGGGGGGGYIGGNKSNNFVDVDDMKDEKVELSFENVEIKTVVSSKKKKKKKKKLL